MNKKVHITHFFIFSWNCDSNDQRAFTKYLFQITAVFFWSKIFSWFLFYLNLYVNASEIFGLNVLLLSNMNMNINMNMNQLTTYIFNEREKLEDEKKKKKRKHECVRSKICFWIPFGILNFNTFHILYFCSWISFEFPESSWMCTFYRIWFASPFSFAVFDLQFSMVVCSVLFSFISHSLHLLLLCTFQSVN